MHEWFLQMQKLRNMIKYLVWVCWVLQFFFIYHISKQNVYPTNEAVQEVEQVEHESLG